MFVAANEEDFRKAIREETLAAFRAEMRGLVAGGPTVTQDPEQILTYADAGKLIGRSKETIRTYVAKNWLTKYGRGKAVGVKRVDVIDFMANAATSRTPAPMSADQEADAIVSGKRRKPKR
jgi:hypothetical protein